MLKDIEGLDGPIFFKGHGKCKVDKATLLRVCTKARARGGGRQGEGGGGRGWCGATLGLL